MATFIPNVTGVYPGPVDTKLDIDRIERMLRLRESMYQDGVKKVKTLFESAFNSAMLRDDNIERRDKYLKLIQDGLKNVSGMDLSLAQNQNIASGLFQPILEDKYLVNDIAYTKKYQKELAKANALKSSSNGSDRRRYWDEGVQYLTYKAEEFKNTSEQGALNMSSPSYIENVDYVKYAQDMFDESGISVSIDEVNGGYIYTKKNGDVVYPIAKDYVTTLFSQDPAIKEMLQAKAYVQRKAYAKANAGRFNGSEEEAEMEYLTDVIEDQYDLQEKQIEKFEKELANAKNQLFQIEKAHKKNGTDFTTSDIYIQTKDEIAQYETILKTRKEQLFDKNEINYESLDDLRFTVDNIAVFEGFGEIVDESARLLSHKDASISIKPDPYALADYKHNLSMNLASYRSQLAYANSINSAIEKKRLGLSGGGRTGGGNNPIDPSTGNQLTNEQYKKLLQQQLIDNALKEVTGGDEETEGDEE
jgi:hypothetical protein